MTRFSGSALGLIFCFFCSLVSIENGLGQTPTDERTEMILANYTKSEVRIAMRDGIEL